MALIAANAMGWISTGILAATFSLICVFWYKVIQSNRNPHAWRKKR